MLDVSDRRHFIQTLVGASLAGLSFGCREAQGASGSLQDLPASLPHLDSIRVYPVLNCKHVLVHVRQSHESNHEEVVYLARGTASRQTVECQTAIRNGLGEFVRRLPCHSIYIEGLKREGVEIMRRSVSGFRDITSEQERFKRRVGELRRLYQSPGTRSDDELLKISAIERDLEKFDLLIGQTVRQLDQESISHSTAIQVAAACNLVAESPNTDSVERFLDRFSQPYDELDVLNKRVRQIKKRVEGLAEQYSTAQSPVASVLEELRVLREEMEAAVEKRAALAARIQEQLKTEESNIFTLREEALVSLIAARPLASPGPDSSLVLFGAKHDFLPEVQAHNTKHPDNAISLVVITPAGLGKIPER